MAVDANVLVFERAREEYAAARQGCGPRSDRLHKAWSAIIDSNVTTLLAAGLLFFLASGPVTGLRRHAVHRRPGLDVLRLVLARVLADWAVRSARRAAAGLTGIGNGRVRDAG